MNIPDFSYLWEYVEHWAGVDPDFPSLNSEGKTVTAGKFQELTDHLAQCFIRLGVEKGDCIATILPQGLPFTLTFIAAGKIGAITVPLDVKYKVEDFRRFISHVTPKVMVAVEKSKEFDITTELEKLASELKKIKLIMAGPSEMGTSLESLMASKINLSGELAARKADLNPDEGELIIFTGGTTGIPKAALISHRNISSTCKVAHNTSKRLFKSVDLDIAHRQSVVIEFPPSHIGGVVETLGVGIAGGNRLILQESWSPVKALELIQNEKLQSYMAAPTMFAIMLSLPNFNTYDVSSLKFVSAGGEKISLELLGEIRKNLCEKIVVGYDSTESPFTTITETDTDLEKLVNGYVGKIHDDVEVMICDEKDRSMPFGEIGEIYTRSEMCIKEYYNMPEENEASFTPEGWVRTGDLGYLTDTGELWFTGRKKQIIRVGTYTVVPTEVEEVAITHPDVSMAVAVGVPDKIYGEVVWLAIARIPGKSVSEDGIITLCSDNLAKFKVPKKIIFFDNLPVSRAGKIDRMKIQQAIMEIYNRSK